ncbi:hypothetical protein BH10PAT2_BH10PAT2_2950 [soil metagenome]
MTLLEEAIELKQQMAYQEIIKALPCLEDTSDIAETITCVGLKLSN